MNSTSDHCACGEREECDHSCMPDVIDGICSHCGERAPGLPILPAGMTNELFYKEQAEYWRQIATQNQVPGVAQAAPDTRKDPDMSTETHTELPMNEDQIKHMVDRFLFWKLPENFNPDGGISFKKTFNEHMPFGPTKYEPSGTNLFDAAQADAMVRHMVDGMPVNSHDALVAALRDAQELLAILVGPKVAPSLSIMHLWAEVVAVETRARAALSSIGGGKP